MLLAIDPGTEQSAYVVYDGKRVWEHSILDNREMIHVIGGVEMVCDYMAIEMVECYGMPVGVETFETVWWIGRFWESFLCCGGHDATKVYRSQVKTHLCNSMRAKDANIRQALIDKFGPGKDKAIGKKATPGPLYGIKSHEWSALAVAVTYWETMR
jgi:hypothetical protein